MNRDVRNMLKTLGLKDDSILKHQDARGYVTEYRLDKDLTMTLITKYDTARRYAVVRRWRELEEQSQGRELSVEEMFSQLKIEPATFASDYADAQGKPREMYLTSKALDG